jgi:hypothetical protein
MNRMLSIRRLSVAVIAAGALCLGAAPSAFAQNQQQEGLVNVAIGNVIVQVPVGVAANICDTTIAILAENADEAAQCTATAETFASSGRGNGGSPNQQQNGLVNVAIGNVIVQAPIGVALNLCDTTVAVLAENADEAAQCTATAESIATAGPGDRGGA